MFTSPAASLVWRGGLVHQYQGFAVAEKPRKVWKTFLAIISVISKSLHND